MLFKNKDKSVFDKIDRYLAKRGHELVLSIYLSNYNGNNIYIRFDYVKQLAVYKIVWVDLNFFDEKHIEDFVSVQMVTKYLSIKITEALFSVGYENSYCLDEDILGDRVEILSYVAEEPREYIFDRFLPLEWEDLVDPLALIFAYLPRGMEVFLNEIFAKYDGTEEQYNYTKPVKFDLLEGNSLRLFRAVSIEAGTRLFESGNVKMLEKIDDKYLAIVEEDKKKHLVLLGNVGDEYSIFLCDCKTNYYCKHTYAALLALRAGQFNNFYKVKYIGQEESLLDKITIGSFYYCFGVEKDKIFLVSTDGKIFPADIVQNGKCAFEVIEDDDDCNLSKELEKYKIK